MKIIKILLVFILTTGWITAQTDSVFVQIQGDTVTIWNTLIHENCTFSTVDTVSVVGDSITVLESDTSTSLVHCDCFFDISVSIIGLPTGNYRVYVYRKYLINTPDSTYFIDSVSFYYNGSNGTMNKLYNQSTCYNPIGIREKDANHPVKFFLQSYPNPFNPSAKLLYSLSDNEYITIDLFDILGRRVTQLVNERKTLGNHELTIDGSKFSSGVYFCRLTAGTDVKTVKILFMR